LYPAAFGTGPESVQALHGGNCEPLHVLRMVSVESGMAKSCAIPVHPKSTSLVGPSTSKRTACGQSCAPAGCARAINAPTRTHT
jgi:hypothetical protein